MVSVANTLQSGFSLASLEGRGERRGGEGERRGGKRSRLMVWTEQELLNEQSPNLLNNGVVCGSDSVVSSVHSPKWSRVLDTGTVKLLLVETQRAESAPKKG